MDYLTEVLVHSELVFEVNGEVVTDSLVIAKTFGKDHYYVLEDIVKILYMRVKNLRKEILTSPLISIHRVSACLNTI